MMTAEPAIISAVNLRSVRIQVVSRAEASRWDALIIQHHYLGTRGMVGEHLRQVAVDESGTWLALLGWTTAAFKCQARDRWIGWLPSQQWRRLPLVVNNARFLILPWVRVPHLASRVLALSTRRLDADWRERHGHGVLLAETFVDGTRFRGTCYRAAGWEVLGQTRGFRRSAGRYVAHGQPKLVLARSLAPHAREMLCAAEPPTAHLPQEQHMDPLALNITGVGSLKEALSALADPRKPQGKEHRDFAGLVTLLTMANLAGMRSLAAMTEYIALVPQRVLSACGCARDMRTGKVRPPSEPTIRRTVTQVSGDHLDTIVAAWMRSQGFWRDGGAIAIDGKTLRGSHLGGKDQVVLVAACSHETGSVIAQTAAETKAGESEAALNIVEQLTQEERLRGCMVTADALHTNGHFCTEVGKGGATSCWLSKATRPAPDANLFASSTDSTLNGLM